MTDIQQGPGSEPQGPSVYRQILDREERQRDDVMRASFNQAVKADPAKARAASKLAGDIGLPTDVVERNVDDVRAIMARREFEMEDVARHSPIFARQLRDPDFARQVSDEWKGISTLERMGYGEQTGRLNYEKSRIGFAMYAGVESAADYRRLAEIDAQLKILPPTEGFFANAAEILGGMGPSFGKAAVGGTIGAGIGAMAGPASPLTAPIGFGVGAATVFAAESATSIAGAQYLDLIDKQVSPGQARAYATGVGLIGGALDTVGLKFVTAPIRSRIMSKVATQVGEQLTKATYGKAGVEFVKGYLKSAGGEVVTEVGQEITSILAEGAATGDWEGAGDRIAEVASKTAQGMALLALPGSTFGMVHDVQRARAAKDAQARAQGRTEAILGSKLRTENPAAFEKMAAQMDPGELHVEAMKVVDVLRQADKADADAGNLSKSYIEQIDQLIPGFAEQVDEAARTGQDVTIPRAVYDTRLAGTPIGAALEPHLRQGKDAMSPAEADLRLANLPEVEKTAEAQAISADEWDTQAKKIESDIAGELVAAGRKKGEARRGAALARRMFETLAERIGDTPAQAFERWRVKVTAGEPAGGVAQTGRGEFDPDTFTISLSKASDPSTFAHEVSHAFLTIYEQAAAQELHPTIVDDFRAFLKWSGHEEAAWASMTLDQKRKAHENFAANFEAYLWDGKAPDPTLKRLFGWFGKMLRNVYRAIRDQLNAQHRTDFGEDLLDLTPEIRGVFDRMLAAEDRVRATQAIRGALPIFADKASSGLSDADWAAYQDRLREADDAAVADIERRSLADMRWLGNAKSRRLREIQGEAKRVREGERQRVAAEVQKLPVHRALRWLKTGEFVMPDGRKEDSPKADNHKLSREVVKALLGLQDIDIDEAEPAPQPKAKASKRGPSLVTRIKELGGITPESWAKSFPGDKRGEFRIPFLVRKGGMSWEQMAKRLQEDGYGPEVQDEIGGGSGDASWFVEAMANAVAGEATYSRHTERNVEAEVKGPNIEPESDEERAARLRYARMDAEEDRARKASIQLARPERVLAKKLRGVISMKGYHPDEVASLFGFDTGAELVRAIIDAPDIATQIEADTDVAMLQKHGDLVDPDRIEEAIVQALHGEARRRFVASEMAALAGLEGGESGMRVARGAAKLAAEMSLAKRKVGQIDPRAIQMEARRASKQAQEHAKAGETRDAIQAKRRQMVLTEMVDLAIEARDEIAKVRALFDSKHMGRKDADLAKTRDVDYVWAARALGAANSLSDPIAPGQAQGLVRTALEKVRTERPDLFERLTPLLAAGSRQPVNFRELTLEQFRELGEVIDALYQESRQAKLLDAEGKKLELDAVRQELASQVASLPPRNPPGSSAPPGEDPGPVRRRIMGLWTIWASFKRIEHWARFMDGGRDNGPFQRLLVAPIMRATVRYRDAKAGMVRDLHGLLTEHQERNRATWNARIKGERLDHTFNGKHQILAAMLHAGSESGLRKLLVGRKWGSVLTLEDGTEVLDASRWNAQVGEWFQDGTLNAEDVAFLNRTWKLYAKLLPEAQRTHKKLYGHEFETIAHLPTDHGKYGKLEGGYVPARIDKDVASEDIRDMDPTKLEDASFRYSVSTGKGFTIARNPLYNQPLLFDLNQHLQSMDSELRFIHLQPALADAVRLTSRGELRQALDAYDREAVTSIVTPFLQNVALQSTTRPGIFSGRLDWAANALRSAASLSALGFSVINAAIQISGLSNARTQVKGRFMRSALKRFFAGPPSMVRDMTGRSDYMRQRFDQSTRKLQDQLDVMASAPALQGVRTAQKALGRWAFAMQRGVQMVADTTTWHGAFEQAVADGMDDASAVERADSAVRMLQGSQNPEDLAGYEAQTPIGKLFTQFGSFSNLMLNQILSAQGIGGKARATAFALLIPALIEVVIREGLTGGPDDEDQDGVVNDWAASLGRGVVRNVAGLIPVAGPMMMALAESEGTRVASPFSTAIGSFAKGMFEAAEAVGGDDLTAAEATAIAAVFSLLGIPIAAPARHVKMLVGER